jgi:hypothetical protein
MSFKIPAIIRHTTSITQNDNTPTQQQKQQQQQQDTYMRICVNNIAGTDKNA